MTDYVVFDQLPPTESLNANGGSLTALSDSTMAGNGATDEIVFNWTVDAKEDVVGETMYLESKDKAANTNSGAPYTMTVTLTNTGTGNQATADQLQIHSGGVWTILHLYIDGGTPRWVDNFNDLVSLGGTVIPPGHGLFFNNRNSAKSLLTYGEVRENDFIRPLGSGYNFVSSGYPVSQSPTGTGSRTMSLVEGFFGSRDFKTADSFYLWKGDATPGLSTYDTYYMLMNGSAPTPSLLRWVRVGDSLASPRGAEILLLENRAVFTRSAAGLATYGYPSPWSS